MDFQWLNWMTDGWLWDDLQIIKLDRLPIIENTIDALDLHQLMDMTTPHLLVPLGESWFGELLSDHLPFFEIMI